MLLVGSDSVGEGVEGTIHLGPGLGKPALASALYLAIAAALATLTAVSWSWSRASRPYMPLEALERSRAAASELAAACARILASLPLKRPSRAFTSSAAARLFSLRILPSLPRARIDVEWRESESFMIRLSSAWVRRLTRIWAALWLMTSPDTTWISPARRVSWSLMDEVTAAIEVAKALRAAATSSAAFLRAAAMFLTVVAKRESARAACFAILLLIVTIAILRLESFEERSLAILV